MVDQTQHYLVVQDFYHVLDDLLVDVVFDNVHRYGRLLPEPRLIPLVHLDELRLLLIVKI